MGVNYCTLVLNDEVAGWLGSNGIPLPSPLPASRLPTLGELQLAARSLAGYQVTVRGSGLGDSVDIGVVDERGYDAGWSTTIWTKRPKDQTIPLNDDSTVEFSFHRGTPELAVLICQALTRDCGALVLFRDCDAKPILLVDGEDPRPSVAEWITG